MNKAEAKIVEKVFIAYCGDNANHPDFKRNLDAMTEDTDPRLEMLNDMEHYMRNTPLAELSMISILEKIDDLRIKIKQEAEDENNSNGE
jgi:uncharacterized protein (UPF0216 family)